MGENRPRCCPIIIVFQKPSSNPNTLPETSPKLSSGQENAIASPLPRISARTISFSFVHWLNVYSDHLSPHFFTHCSTISAPHLFLFGHPSIPLDYAMTAFLATNHGFRLSNQQQT